jgi:hypothetical protein
VVKVPVNQTNISSTRAKLTEEIGNCYLLDQEATVGS